VLLGNGLVRGSRGRRRRTMAPRNPGTREGQRRRPGSRHRSAQSPAREGL